MTPELKEFIKSNLELSAVAAVFIADKTGASPDVAEIQQLVADTISDKLAQLAVDKPNANDIVDACEKVILTGGEAFGNPKVKELCKDIVDASNAGQANEYFKVFSEGLQIVGDIKAIAKEAKANKGK